MSKRGDEKMGFYTLCTLRSPLCGSFPINPFTHLFFIFLFNVEVYADAYDSGPDEGKGCRLRYVITRSPPAMIRITWPYPSSKS